MAALPEAGFLRLPQILGDKKAGTRRSYPSAPRVGGTAFVRGDSPRPSSFRRT